MNEVVQIPKLRFKEFSDKWEVKKVEKIFSLFNGYAFSSFKSTTDGTLWVKIADVGIGMMKKDNLSYLPLDFIKKHKKFLLKEGDYVVALTRPILNRKLKIAKIDNYFNNSLLNQRVGKIETENNIHFVYFLLQKSKLINLIENSIAGSDPPNLSPKEINSIKQLIPSLDEQQKITSFLASVDKKITQLENKKDLLTKYKKGVMQQIFNQELRFKDDNENDYPEWRNGRIDEFGYFYYGKSAPKFSIFEDALTPCVRYGELYSTYNEVISEIKSYTNIDPKTLKFSQGGEVLVPRVGEDPMDFANCSYLPLSDVAIGEMIQYITLMKMVYL